MSMVEMARHHPLSRKSKMDNLSKTGTAPDLTLILIINLKVFCKVTFRIISASIKFMSGTSAFFRYSQF